MCFIRGCYLFTNLKCPLRIKQQFHMERAEACTLWVFSDLGPSAFCSLSSLIVSSFFELAGLAESLLFKIVHAHGRAIICSKRIKQGLWEMTTNWVNHLTPWIWMHRGRAGPCGGKSSAVDRKRSKCWSSGQEAWENWAGIRNCGSKERSFWCWTIRDSLAQMMAHFEVKIN